MATFEQGLDQNLQFFISMGTYLAISKLKFLALRNKFQKVVMEVKNDKNKCPHGSHVIPLNHFLSGLKEWDETLDIDDVEAVASNLCHLILIKGCISS